MSPSFSDQQVGDEVPSLSRHMLKRILIKVPTNIQQGALFYNRFHKPFFKAICRFMIFK